jgi:putative ABC transport system ATP-binding protein
MMIPNTHSNPKLDLNTAVSHSIVFHVQGITKVYRMGEVEVQALRSVDLDLYEGDLVVFLGPSGSGKSTLLNILGGLDIPSSGHFFFRERGGSASGYQDLTRANDTELTRFRRDYVGFIFQFYNLIPSLTARENVALVTEIARQPMRPEQALELVGLGDRLDHFPAQMSGGEQQRVAIARAIAKRPEVLLCDEPTGALDYQTGKLVLEALSQVNQDLGTTTAIITHNAGIAAMADRVITMRNGQITNVQKNIEKLTPDQLEW